MSPSVYDTGAHENTSLNKNINVSYILYLTISFTFYICVGDEKPIYGVVIIVLAKAKANETTISMKIVPFAFPQSSLAKTVKRI